MPRGKGYRKKMKNQIRRTKKKIRTVGKIFRTRTGKIGRYVYVNGKRVGFEGVKTGARRYVARRTDNELQRRFGK